jgi:hypothetical protein
MKFRVSLDNLASHFILAIADDHAPVYCDIAHR